MRFTIVLAAVLAIALTTVPAMAADNAGDFHALSKMTQASSGAPEQLSDQELASVEGQGLLGGVLGDCLCNGNLIKLPKISLTLVVKAKINTNSRYYHY
jgi:hypothetical protein